MKIIISGGGSGGHVIPSLAIIEALKKEDSECDILYIGSKNGIENKIIPKIGIPFETISAGKWRRYHKRTILNILDPTTLPVNFLDFIRFIKGIFEAIQIIKKFEPNSIFIKGGYVGLPVGIAARILGYPFVIHESDVVPGLTNKILSRWAKYVLVSYPVENYKGVFKHNNLFYSGTPIREDLKSGDRERGFRTFNLKESIPVIMIIGGSQGARAINEAILSILEDILDKYQVIHITGELDYDKVEYRVSKLPYDLKEKYRFYNFLTDSLKDAYSISSLVISRAGNNVLTELAYFKKPSILIPLPSSANAHQYKNALMFSRNGASYIIEGDKLTPSGLKRQINYLFDHCEELEHMSSQVSKFYKEDAAFLIARKIMEVKLLKKNKDKKNGLLSKEKKDKE